MKKTYDFKVHVDRKKAFLIFSGAVLVTALILAIISLLPDRTKKAETTSVDSGLSMDPILPFVYSSENNLYVLSSDKKNLEVDDTVENAIFDKKSDKVYYLREKVLYEYNIKKNERIKISENTTNFKIFYNRTAFIYSTADNHTFIYKNGKSVQLNFNMAQSENLKQPTAMGNKYVLFLENYNVDEKIANLMILSPDGRIKQVAEGINVMKSFYLSEDESLIYYYKKENLFVSDRSGKIKQQFNNSMIILNPKQISLPSDNVSGNVAPAVFTSFAKTHYVLENIGENSQSAELVYFTDRDKKVVDNNVYKIMTYSADRDVVVYLKKDGSKIIAYVSIKGATPKKVTECSDDSRFMIDDKYNFLYVYIPPENNTLYRINLYDKVLNKNVMSDDVSDFYKYFKKDIIVYIDKKQENQYTIINGGNPTLLNMKELPLYGISYNKYLFCRQASSGKITLDLVSSDTMTRITGDLNGGVYFDGQIKNVLYISKDNLCLWENGNSTMFGNLKEIKMAQVFE